MASDTQRLIVVSNRLPIAIEEIDERDGGGYRAQPGSGGLVTAMGPVLAERGGRWVGWFGMADSPEVRAAIEGAEHQMGYSLDGVPLTDDEVEGYYRGFANEVLWPLFHDFVGYTNFDPKYWPTYLQVNRKFAQRVAQIAGPADFVWIHDYHLMMVGHELRAMGVQQQLGFFLHIPFPSLDLFSKMPWRQQILEGLLDYDLVGLQTERDLRNLAQCVKHRIPDAVIEDAGELCRIEMPGGRVVHVGVFPISIDYEDFLHRSVADPVSEMVAQVRAQLPGRRLILGLDRLDYSKGIPQRIAAFGNALDRYPELRGKTTMLQVVVPSRTRVEEYATLKDEIDRLVGAVNGRHTRAGWAPIQHIFRSLTPTELLAYYRVCDIALITPLKDGMNLVCKEYCACSLEGNGVLILSEFAGAAQQLSDGALIVNPFDIEQVADSIKQAVQMPDEERRERMQKLRRIIHEYDVFRWVEHYMSVARQAAGRSPGKLGLAQ